MTADRAQAASELDHDALINELIIAANMRDPAWAATLMLEASARFEDKGGSPLTSDSVTKVGGAMDLLIQCARVDPTLREAAQTVDDAIRPLVQFGQMAVAAGPAVLMVAAERQRQVEVEGWTPEHDNKHERGEIVRAAICYAEAADSQRLAAWDRPIPPFAGWPWGRDQWKPSDDPIRNLVKAGALIAAEIDRLSGATP